MEVSFQNFVDTDPRWIKARTDYNNSPLKKWLLLFSLVALSCGIVSFFPVLLNNDWLILILSIGIFLFFISMYLTFFGPNAYNKLYQPSSKLEELLNILKGEYIEKYNSNSDLVYKYYDFIEQKIDPNTKHKRKSFFKFIKIKP